MSKIVKQATKHYGKPRKEEIVAELVEKIDNSKALVFTDYQGLTHVQLETLKKELKKLDATIIIAKNSLLRISLGKSKNYADFKDNEKLNLPTATLFMQGDYVEPLKRVKKANKDFGLPKIKFGILEGQALDEAQVLMIASLPNRETLLAQLVGTLNSPIQGLVVTLNGTIQKFVMTLSAVASAKQNLEPVQAETTSIETPAKTTTDQTAEATPPAVEPAVHAAPPIEQAPAPVETDELADAGTEALAPAEEAATEETDQTPTKENANKADEEKGGEN